ncbi:gliding motility-associated C-terminal domain-containing protein [Flavobacterium sp.]|uniref:T9SS type B sorting domain-containing protein n=1 Tax=Flavobacterium sp. TaxID=239 RepID=UPI0039E4B6BE
MFCLISCVTFAQNVTLYQQFNGRYDFVFFGNTHNIHENGTGFPCETLTSSSATLNLAAGNTIESAYLYWAGSGTGDFDILLNGTSIAPDRTFSFISSISGLPYFSAFKDVTTQVAATGNGNYLLSELDITPFLIDGTSYCANATNFAGWAIIVIYKNDALPLNQLNIYDGLQGVPSQLNITLDNLNVIDNDGAKIGFVAWEGDRSIAVNETLTINGNVVGNPPLNPFNNAFNGTNSFTGANNLYNMDLDVYDIQGFIDIGDTSAEIQLTSGQDVVMINAVVTKLNSQLPDATVVIDDVDVNCGSRKILVDYTVSNLNATKELPANVRIAFYADGQFVHSAQTTQIIPIGQSESGQASVLIPETIPDDFELQLVVDDNGLGEGGVTELDETNNSFAQQVSFRILPELHPLDMLYSCNIGLTKGVFNFAHYADLVSSSDTAVVTFYPSEEDAENETNAILDPQHYTAPYTPKEIFVRVDDGCYAIGSFFVAVRNCPPTVYNFISANEDGKNDDFFIAGLRDIFMNFKLSVYNRWGRLIWTGNNNMPNWNGDNNEGFIPMDSRGPDGTYYYILELNDPDYPAPLHGFLYLTKT